MATTPEPAEHLLDGLNLPLLRARVTLRLMEDATLPEYKGAMLRGGFGYAFQRASCPVSCWGHSHDCTIAGLCAYRQVFETPRPPGVEWLHDLRDVPRPFVIVPPSDTRTRYEAGEALEFGLVLIGHGIEYLPYFLYGFDRLSSMGLGRAHARGKLERVETLRAWEPAGQIIYQDGRTLSAAEPLPLIDTRMVQARAALLPADLRLTLHTPLRVKTRGSILKRLDPLSLIHAICWRLSALAAFHGEHPWPVDYRRFVDAARGVRIESEQIRWLDLLRTSTRGSAPHTMPQGGIIGSAIVRNVSEALRALVVLGSLVHVGKACTFGHGGYRVEGIEGLE